MTLRAESFLTLFICSLEGEKEVLPEWQQAFEVATAPTSGLFSLVFSRQNGFFECKHPFIDKPMVTTEPSVACAWVVGLGSKLYLRNMPRMLNKDVTRFMPGFSRVRHNQASGRKGALLVGCLQIYW